MSMPTVRLLLLSLAVLLATSVPLDAQFGRLVRGAIDREVKDALAGAVECALGDEKCVEDAKNDGKDVVIVDDDGNPILDDSGNPVTDPAEADTLAQKPGEGVWRNYDFTPGKEVWFASDFSNERVGRFPASQLEFVQGNMQIVELNGEKVLEVAQDSLFRINLPEMLPEDFTLEFHLEAGAPNIGTTVLFTPREGAWNRYESQYLIVNTQPGIYYQGSAVSTVGDSRGAADEFHPIKFQVDGDYAIMYLGTDRAANIPNASFLRTNVVEFHVAW